jgi:cell division inhibitor SepF
MAGSMRNAMRRLGLAPADSEEDYYDYEGSEETLADVTPITRGGSQVQGPYEAVADEMHRIVTARPRSYNEAKTVGSPYREGIPVIMNLSETSDADSQRLVDFAGGLTYAMHGRLERITSRVFLLSPSSFEVREVSGDFHRRSFDGE